MASLVTHVKAIIAQQFEMPLNEVCVFVFMCNIKRGMRDRSNFGCI